MKRFLIIVVFLIPCFFLEQGTFAQNGYDLFQKALMAERSQGDLEEAIQMYRQIIRDFPDDRALAASALMQMGGCYEKQGRQEAKRIYQRLIKEYTDQLELVTLAQSRLAALERSSSVMSTRQVWAPALDTMGAPSPNGRYISFVNWNNGNLALHDTQTDENRDLTSEGTWEGDSEFCDVSIWSPDGSRIAYCWITGYQSDLRIVGLDGPKPRILHRDFQSGYLWPRAWSHDGKHILGVFCNKGTEAAKESGHLDKIAMISVEDGSLRILKSLGNRRSSYMDFSPDDRYLVFDLETEEGSGTSDIHLMTFDGSRETPLVVHPANDGAPFWTPDGKHIFFASDRSGSFDMWIIEVDEGKPIGDPAKVRGIGKEFNPMGFTGDGSFYYSIGVSDLDIYIAALDFETGNVSAAPKKISLRYEGSNYAPAWSPDGKYLSYLSQRGYSERVLVIKNLETGKERDLLPKTNVQLMQNRYMLAPQWSPDSNSILVTGVDGNLNIARGLYLIDAESGNVFPIVRYGSKKEDGQYAEPYWQVYSKDGTQIYYIGNNKSVMVHNLKTHAERELYKSETGLHRLAISRDGLQLAFLEAASAIEGGTLKTMSALGGPARELYTMKKAKRGSRGIGLSWTPDGSGIVLGQRDIIPEIRTEFWLIPIKGGEPKKLELPVRANHMSLHPDGRRIVFTGGELGGSSEIWAMENFLSKQ